MSCLSSRGLAIVPLCSRLHGNKIGLMYTCCHSFHKSTFNGSSEATKTSGQRISQAMRFYLEKSQAYEKMMKQEVAEFEIGKRHLAKIMSLDPDDMTQEHIDAAIEYLMPSGLFDKKARPMMKHPKDVIPAQKVAQFGADGRPFHTMYYTCFPHYYHLMHDIAVRCEKLKQFEDTQIRENILPKPDHQYSVVGTVHITKTKLEEHCTEKLSDQMYESFTLLLDRLVSLPYSQREEAFINRYRKQLVTAGSTEDKPEIQYDEAGKAFSVAKAKRKQAEAEVKLWRDGQGDFTVNGVPMVNYFYELTAREQVMYPLHFLGLLGEVDVEATVDKGGFNGQAGAIRLAMSRAFTAFADSRDIVEKMRIAGLLTHDIRIVERQKPGQSGARRKFTWKKR